MPIRESLTRAWAEVQPKGQVQTEGTNHKPLDPILRPISGTSTDQSPIVVNIVLCLHPVSRIDEKIGRVFCDNGLSSRATEAIAR
jgi:hypothetical protein